LEFKNALKITSLTQFLVTKETSSYEDDNGSFLTTFLDFKAVSQPKKIKEIVEVNGEPILDETFDFSDTNSLSYLAGYCLKKTFENHQHCSDCYQYYTSNVRRPEHSLIKLKEFKENSLMSTSEECETMFHIFEKTFRHYSPTLDSINGIGDVLKEKARQECLKVLIDIPKCHDVLSRLITRFMHCRTHFLFKHKTSNLSKKKIHSSSEGSKSMCMRKRVQ